MSNIEPLPGGTPGRPVSIRERILRQIKHDLEAAPYRTFGTIYRWDGRGIASPNNGDVVIVTGEEQIDEDTPGNPGPVTCTLPVYLCMYMVPGDTDTVATGEALNYWASMLFSYLAANRVWIETTTNKRLAIDTTFDRVDNPEFLAGQVAATVRADVLYRHDGTSANSYGSAIPATTE